MSKKKNRILIVIGIIFTFVVLVAGGGYIAVTRGLPEMQEIVINDISPVQMPDGEYTGEFNRYRWSNKVTVIIESGRIVEIQSVNDGDLELELSEQIIARQSLEVDITSGATVSSNAFLKAVEDALTR